MTSHEKPKSPSAGANPAPVTPKVEDDEPKIGLVLPHRPPRPLPDDMPELVKRVIQAFDRGQDMKVEFLREKFEAWGYRGTEKVDVDKMKILDVGVGADHNKAEGHNVHDQAMRNAEKAMEKGAEKGGMQGIKEYHDAEKKLIDGQP